MAVIRIRTLTTAAVALALVLAPASGAGAWPGDPDGRFGACGDLGVDAVPGEASVGRAAAPGPGGTYVVAGNAGDAGLVMRRDDAGADAEFGRGGVVRVSYTGTARYDAVAVGADAKVVAAGRRTTGTRTDSVLVRLTAAGKLDTTFDGNGRVAFDAGGDDSARAVAVDAAGRVIVAGNASSGGYVARYTAAGRADPAWAGDGRRSGLPLDVRALALRADGSVYVAGGTGAAPSDWRILRLAPDASVDTGFGGPSGRTVDTGGDDVVTAVGAGGGGLVVAGTGGGGRMHVRRYLADGRADPDFSPYRAAFGTTDTPAALRRLADGSVLVAASSRVGPDRDVVLVRLGADGTPDATFGIGGASLLDAGARPTVGGLVLDRRDRPIVVGSVRTPRQVVGLFRFQPDASGTAVATAGVVADAFGGLHPWRAGCRTGPARIRGGPYWPGWDIVRGVAVLPAGRGLVVDAFGGVHPFSVGDAAARPAVRGTPYWLGWDIVRGIAVVPQATGGFVLDGFGGLHAFAIGSGRAPRVPPGAPYWPGRDRARGVALTPDGGGGYVVDAYGAVHAFGDAPKPASGAPRWPGWDVARGITLAADGSGGWILDAFGSLHPFATAGDPAPPAAAGTPRLPAPLARGAAALP